MTSVRVKRRFFIVRRFRRWLYRLFREEEELERQATGWHKVVSVPAPTCTYCGKPLSLPTGLFCNHCGWAMAKVDQHTTGAQKLVLPMPVERVATMELPKPPAKHHVLTNQIEAAAIPNEDYGRMKAYNRLRKQGKV